jgi:hypothetical protein
MENTDIIKVCIKDFERAKKYGLKENNWLPFKQSWFHAYELGRKSVSNS